MQIREVVLVSAVRTAIGKFMGGLKVVQARDPALAADREAGLCSSDVKRYEMA